jgi:cytochrome c peroxidase
MKKLIVIVAAIASVVFIQAGVLNTSTGARARLGEMLFFDPILSLDSSISCASCHRPERAFADTSAVSLGVGGRKGVRNTQTAMNLSLGKTFFWDGRAKTLEDQALMPIENPVEMNLPVETALMRLKRSSRYLNQFRQVFNSEPTRGNLAEALAAFERTLETSDSPFDNWKFSDDSTAVSESVRRGFTVFNTKGKCSTCHFGSDFTAQEFRNIGLFNGKKLNDSGRSVISKNPEDLGKFKTSSLRNIELTAPYMHNGMFKTLDEVIEFYNDTRKIVPDAINKDTLLNKPLGLTTREKKDLKAFLLALTDKRFKPIKHGG